MKGRGGFLGVLVVGGGRVFFLVFSFYCIGLHFLFLIFFTFSFS